MFAALERLGNDELSQEEMAAEIARAKAVSDIGKVIVESAKTEVLHLKLMNRLDRPGFLEKDGFVDDEGQKKIERPKAIYTNINGHVKTMDKLAQ